MSSSTIGSNVHEAFALQATLLAPRVPMRFLELTAQILQRRQMEEVFEERFVQKRCAFPACENPLPTSAGKYRVSLARKEIYESQYERQFCSQLCVKKARVLLSRLAHKPPQLVPSLLEVFGTTKPNPYDFDDGKPELQQHTEAASIDAKQMPLPKAKAVWSKTDTIGVVERKHSTANAMSVGVPPALEAATATELKENESAPPARNFPTAEQAVLIEGYVFPSHKKKLARKVEKLVQKSQEENQDEDDVVVSDSDESDAAGSEASSVDSFEISDFDDEEVVMLDDLPLFSHLWGLVSSWVTHETTLLVAGLPLPEKKEEDLESDEAFGGPSKADKEAGRRRARQIFVERWNSLSLMLRRPLPQVALKLKLASDRYTNHRIDTITETFKLYDAIDTRNAHQWKCVATILMLVAHDIKPEGLLEGERSDQVKELTKLDMSELQLLLNLFYEVRKDSEVAIDTDTDSAPVESAAAADSILKESGGKPSSICRKCRRVKSKCICGSRAKTAKEEEFSTSQLEEMMQEALNLREEYDEMLEPDD